MPDPAREPVDPKPADGELGSVEHAVRQHQAEALRLAYLLRGNRSESLDLARKALETCARELLSGAEIPEFRLRMLETLARLDTEFGRPAGPGPDDNIAEGSERARIHQALLLVEPRVRTALVLCDVGAMSDREACRLTGLDPAAVRLEFGSARRRLRDAAGLGESGSAFEPLSRLLRDAPRDDMWVDIAPDCRRLLRRRQRRVRMVSVSLVAVTCLMLLGGLIWLTGFRFGESESQEPSSASAQSSVPAPTSEVEPADDSRTLSLVSPTAMPAAAIEPVGVVPDMQLINAIEQGGDQRLAALAYQPAENLAEELMPAGSIALISPDGEWAVFQRRLGEGLVELGAARVDGFDLAWRVEVMRPHAAVIHDGRLLLGHFDSDLDQLAIQLLDLATGEERAIWSYGSEELQILIGHQFKLFAAPDGERIHLMAEAYTLESDVWTLSLVTLGARDGEVLDVHQRQASQSEGDLAPDFDLRWARLTVDGSAIYSKLVASRERRVEVVFIDVETGRRESIRLPFDMRDDPWFINAHTVTSNTGRLLYLIYPDRQQVAIIDLLQRELQAIMPIGPNGFGRVGFENRLWQGTTYMVTTLSPDGARMYLSIVWEKNASFRSILNRSSVWVIDTLNWTIEQTWSIPGQPSNITTSHDGETIYLSYEAARGGIALMAIDAVSGEILYEREEFPVPEWTDIPRFTSLAQLYLEQHGWRPIVNGIAPADVEDTRMLPAIEIDTSTSALITGEATPIKIEFLHPVTGRTLSSAANDVRFDPGARVTVYFTSAEGDVVGIVPERRSAGVYAGKVLLSRAGRWGVRIQVDGPDGSTWTIERPGTIQVVAGLTSDDGPGYRLHVRPENPVSRRTLTLRGWLIDTKTFETLDDGDPRLEQAPNTIELMLYSETGGYLSTTIERLEGGRYLGWARFEAPGSWRAVAVFEGPGGEQVRVDAGAFDIVGLAGTELERDRDPIEEESRRRSDGGWPAGR